MAGVTLDRPDPAAVDRAGVAAEPGLDLRIRRLGRWALVAAWHGLVRFYTSDNLTYAASISFYALLSLFPFLLLAMSVLGTVTADEADRARVLTFIFHYFPTQFGFLTRQLDAFRQTRVEIGVVGAVSLIWAALGVFGAVSTAVNHAWGVEKPRSFLGHKLFSFLMLLAAGGILVIALLLVSAAQLAHASWFNEIMYRFPVLAIVQTIAVGYAPTLLLIAVLGLVYYFVPNAKVRFSDVWLGAIISGLAWRVATWGFSWYVRDMSRVRMVHGSISAVVMFLLWVYLSAVILLYGVEFTAAFGLLRQKDRQ